MNTLRILLRRLLSIYEEHVLKYIYILNMFIVLWLQIFEKLYIAIGPK